MPPPVVPLVLRDRLHVIRTRQHCGVHRRALPMTVIFARAPSFDVLSDLTVPS